MGKISIAKHSSVLFASVYRHPTDSVHQVASDLDDLEGQVQHMSATHKGVMVLAGDLNVNLLDKSHGSPGHKFLKLADTYG